MDSNHMINKNDIVSWLQGLKLLQGSSIISKEEKSWSNFDVISIEIENENSMGIIIVYEDNQVYFNFMNKKDESLTNYDRSEKYQDYGDLIEKIEQSLLEFWH